MTAKIHHCLAVAVFVLLFPSSLHSASFDLDDVVLGQVRQNQNLEREVPVNEYLGFAGAVPDWRFSGETNMRFFRDFARKINDYDLYQAVLHVKPVDALQIDFGRQFINEGFVAVIEDALKLKIMPPGYVDITIYTGIPRDVETSNFDKNNGLYSGLSLDLKNVHGTSAGLHATWQRNDMTHNNWKQNDSILVGADLSHKFAVKTTPMVYGVFEYDVTGKVIYTGTAGIDIYPWKRLAVNAEFDVFNVNRDTNTPTVIGLFTRGKTYSGRLSTTWTIIPEILYFVQNYAYQRLAAPSGMSKNGQLLDVAFQVALEKIGLNFEPGYYFSKSFGGTVNGAHISINEQFTEKLSADLSFDFSQYTKITNNNDNAYSTILWAGYEALKGLMLSAGFEYDRNAFLKKDIRGSFKVAYVFDH